MAKTHRDKNGRLSKYGFNEFRRMQSDIIAIESEKEVKNRNAIPNLDTEHRKLIQNEIESLLNEGKNKIEVLLILNEKYPDSKLSKYFGSYIDNKIKYLEKQKKAKGILRDDD